MPLPKRRKPVSSSSRMRRWRRRKICAPHAPWSMRAASRSAWAAVQAEAASTAAQADLEAARADAQSAFAQLASLAGMASLYTGVVDSLLPLANTLPPPPNEPPVVAPAVVAAEAEREAAARRIAVERTRAVPDITPSLGVRRLTGNNK